MGNQPEFAESIDGTYNIRKTALLRGREITLEASPLDNPPICNKRNEPQEQVRNHGYCNELRCVRV